MDQFHTQMRAKAYASDPEVLQNLATLAPSPEAREQGVLRQANGARTKVQGHQIAVHT